MDEQYIRTSILDPRAQTHAGYPPIMPPYDGRISEEELAALVEYIRSLEG
jgi:cytochrome c oxidase subunit 2